MADGHKSKEDPESPRYTLADLDRATDQTSPFYETEEAARIRDAWAGTDWNLATRNYKEMLDQINGISKRLQNITQPLIEATKAQQAALKQGIMALNISPDAISNLRAEAERAAALLGKIERLRPYLEAELKKPEYEGIGPDELADLVLEGTPESDASKLLEKAIAAAEQAMRAAEQAAPTDIKAIRADLIEYPIDKINRDIWNLLETDTAGQLTFAMESEKDKKRGIKLDLIYSINFDAIEKDVSISKRLTMFDKRVYIAISALFNAGNNIFTLTQIHYAMGNVSSPSQPQLEKINESITKMHGAQITVDNTQEAAAYKYNYERPRYDGSLLPMERGTKVSVNGKLADAVIHVFREPPMMTFAKIRKQITTIDIKLLQSPFNKTDQNLSIEDYLIERIARGKKKKNKSVKILLETLYEKTGITSSKQRQRAPEKLKGYLKHHVKCGIITRFSITDSYILAYF